jgi:hypothetical protein
MLLFLIGEKYLSMIPVFYLFSALAGYQVIHRHYLGSRSSLDMWARRQYPLAEILGPDHYQLDRLGGRFPSVDSHIYIQCIWAVGSLQITFSLDT